MMTKLFILVLCALFTLFAPAMATQLPGEAVGGNIDLFTLLENGGQSMAFLVAMYWLKDSHSRRVEGTKEFAQQLKEIKQTHREEIQRMQDIQNKELIHCQDQVSSITNKLFEWIAANNESK